MAKAPTLSLPRINRFLGGTAGKKRAIKTKSPIKVKRVPIPFIKVHFALSYVASAFISPHLTTRRSPSHLSIFQTPFFLAFLSRLDYSPQKYPLLKITKNRKEAQNGTTDPPSNATAAAAAAAADIVAAAPTAVAAAAAAAAGHVGPPPGASLGALPVYMTRKI